MRDPLDRFHSRYRFNREILPKLQNQLMIRQAQGRSKNINDCAFFNHTECKYSGTLERYLLTLLLTSPSPSPKSLLKALAHLKSQKVLDFGLVTRILWAYHTPTTPTQQAPNFQRDLVPMSIRKVSQVIPGGQRDEFQIPNLAN